MRNKSRQSFALLTRRFNNPWIRFSKPSQSSMKKFFCGRSDSTAALPEGPTENELCKTIVFSSHPSKPFVDKGGLSDTGAANYCNDIYNPICPCVIQESDIWLSIKNIASRNGQSVY